VGLNTNSFVEVNWMKDYYGGTVLNLI